MKTAGIICEYNPFHTGHARHFRLLRQQLGDDCRIVCVMSGNYVQRGLPAMWDKYTRAAAAIANGADLVVELPLYGVLQSAEGFARTGVEVLSRMRCVDVLSFGAECGSAEPLLALAQEMESSDFRLRLQQALSEGLPYAAARQQAVSDPDALLSLPNNILGLEYCRAIVTLNSHLIPLAVPRTGDYHALTADVQAPSATAVRHRFPDGGWCALVPEETAGLLRDAPWYDIRFGERAVLARLRAMEDAQWSSVAHGSEGLWSKAMKAARSQSTLEEIVTRTKSKRYPQTRIQRLLLCAYLGISQEDLGRSITYTRILGVSQRGRGIIREARTCGTLPLLNPGQTPPVPWEMERRAADLFTLFAADGYPCPCRMEQTARLSL